MAVRASSCGSAGRPALAADRLVTLPCRRGPERAGLVTQVPDTPTHGSRNGGTCHQLGASVQVGDASRAPRNPTGRRTARSPRRRTSPPAPRCRHRRACALTRSGVSFSPRQRQADRSSRPDRGGRRSACSLPRPGRRRGGYTSRRPREAIRPDRRKCPSPRIPCAARGTSTSTNAAKSSTTDSSDTGCAGIPGAGAKAGVSGVVRQELALPGREQARPRVAGDREDEPAVVRMDLGAHGGVQLVQAGVLPPLTRSWMSSASWASRQARAEAGEILTGDRGHHPLQARARVLVHLHEQDPCAHAAYVRHMAPLRATNAASGHLGARMERSCESLRRWFGHKPVSLTEQRRLRHSRSNTWSLMTSMTIESRVLPLVGVGLDHRVET